VACIVITRNMQHARGYFYVIRSRIKLRQWRLQWDMNQRAVAR